MLFKIMGTVMVIAVVLILAATLILPEVIRGLDLTELGERIEQVNCDAGFDSCSQ